MLRAFGRVPVALKLISAMLGDALSRLGWKPYARFNLVYDLPFNTMALTNDPVLVERIMVNRSGTFPKNTAVHLVLKPLIGDGLFGLPGGDPVKERRRLFIRSLSQIEGDRIEAVTHDITMEYIQRWLATSSRLKCGDEFSRLAVDIVSECTMGCRFSEDESKRFSMLFTQYHRKAVPAAFFFADPDSKTRDRLLKEMGLAKIGQEMRKLIHDRFIRDLFDVPRDQLASFPRLLAESGWLTPDRSEALIDEVAVMLLAGHETSASTLAWLSYELSRQPDLQKSAARAVAGIEDATSPFQGQQPVDILNALANEALRLHPPIGIFLRQNQEPLAIGSRTIPPDSFLMVSPRTLHRHRKFWPEPDRFSPLRWLTEAEGPAKTSFMPFGLGPRACPGARFATIELAEITRLVLLNTTLSPALSRKPRNPGKLTSRPHPEIILTIGPR